MYQSGWPSRDVITKLPVTEWIHLPQNGVVASSGWWSRDSKFIYFRRPLDDRGVFRIALSGGQAEKIADLKDWHDAAWWGRWMELALQTRRCCFATQALRISTPSHSRSLVSILTFEGSQLSLERAHESQRDFRAAGLRSWLGRQDGAASSAHTNRTHVLRRSRFAESFKAD